MKSLIRLVPIAAALLLSSCLSNSGGGNGPGPSVARVQVPAVMNLGPLEKRLLPELVEALQDAGYQITEGQAEFQADFRINQGPINAETRMNFSRGNQSLAYATGRVGGPAKLFKGDQYAESSFFKCLQDFEYQLPKAHAFGRGNRYPTQSVNYPEPPADWRTGWN
jgi:hypothetical protein